MGLLTRRIPVYGAVLLVVGFHLALSSISGLIRSPSQPSVVPTSGATSCEEMRNRCSLRTFERGGSSAREGAKEHGEVFVNTEVGSTGEIYASIFQPTWPLRRGASDDGGDDHFEFVVPSDTTRICVDVGAHTTSPSAREWWKKDPNTFVVALEPNPFSFAILSRMAHPHMVFSPSNYWDPKFCDVARIGECLRKRLAHVASAMGQSRFLPIQAAASDREGLTVFQLGFENHTDSGSLFDFLPSYEKKQKARNKNIRRLPTAVVSEIPLSHVLRLLPRSVMWDTLKIDAQGADALVVKGAGDFVERFACIVGEFDSSEYALFSDEKGGRNTPPPTPKAPRGVYVPDRSISLFGYKEHLVKRHGFIMVDQHFFVNPRFAAQIRDGTVLCRTSDENRKRELILKVLNHYDHH